MKHAKAMIAEGEIKAVRYDSAGERPDDRVLKVLALAQIYGADLSYIEEVRDHKGNLMITWKPEVFEPTFDEGVKGLRWVWKQTSGAIKKAWEEVGECEIEHLFRVA
jgi:hypothetical protein